MKDASDEFGYFNALRVKYSKACVRGAKAGVDKVRGRVPEPNPYQPGCTPNEAWRLGYQMGEQWASMHPQIGEPLAPKHWQEDAA